MISAFNTRFLRLTSYCIAVFPYHIIDIAGGLLGLYRCGGANAHSKQLQAKKHKSNTGYWL